MVVQYHEVAELADFDRTVFFFLEAEPAAVTESGRVLGPAGEEALRI